VVGQMTMCGRRGGENEVLRWKPFSPNEAFSMSPGYAKKSNPYHPRHAQKHDDKERPQSSTPSPRDRTFRRENDFIRALVPTTVQPA